MIIIKPSLQDQPSDQIPENSARAPFFLVFQNEEFIKSIKNPFVTWGGAWFAVADLLKNEACEKFIAKKVGDSMKNKLDEYGIICEIIT
jgi:predicted Fe-Mo cluster-binding NifX family protein